jgi:hypothetical protein
VPGTEVVYCEGWDPVSREAYATMTEASAAARDRDGAQYAVLLLESGRPVALIQVAWAAGYLGVWQFDEQARRIREFDFQVLHDPGRLYWWALRAWLPASPHDPEFSDRRPRLGLTIGPDGKAELKSSRRGRGGTNTLITSPHIPDELRTIGKAPFGDWWSYVGPGLFDPASAPPAAESGAESSGGPGTGAAGSGWTPPTAVGARNIEALFTAGARLRCGPRSWPKGGQLATVGKPGEAGTLRLPSGRVVAADPVFLNEDSKPFTVTVPPGDYPVSIGSASCEREYGKAGDRRTAVDEEVTAVRVLIRDEPAVTWEMALLPGQDPRMLPAGHFFGFGVDGGTGAFLDAVGRRALSARYAAEGTSLDDSTVTSAGWTEDPDSGTNMVEYRAGLGDGVYPVWIGRDAGGQVVSLVADMLLLNDAELLSSGAESAARYVIPDPVPGTGSRLAAPPASAADLGRYADELLEPLRSAEAKATVREPVKMSVNGARSDQEATAQEPVEMTVIGTWFDKQDIPELRLPEHDRAVGLAKGDVWNFTFLAGRYREGRRNYNMALDFYTRALELDPDYAFALGGRGDAFRLLGHHAEAIADLTRAIELYPGFSAALVSRARAYYALGRYPEALADYDRHERLGFTGAGNGFDSVTDAGRRGDIYRRLGRHDKALDAFNRGLELAPDHAVLLAGRGATYQALGRDEEARADLARAAELAPG